ncbi:alpha/beta fold hydrolase [Qipengyuania sp.]|uniref:alpha/beta fold hydrolase n=1 Tax=Qipengyuania sp. TaxID=2004515 RepID=UPI003BABD2F3
MKPSTKTAQNGNIELWSEAFGEIGDHAVLLVAGANAPGSMWPDSLVSRLVQGGLRVIRYDHRDTGRSTTRDFDEAPYAIADLAADALAVLDAHGIDRAHVVGLSLGGTIGQLLAIEAPERLRSLTLMLTAALDVDFAGAYMRAMNGETSPGPLPGPAPDVVRQLAAMFTPGETEAEEVGRRVEVWRTLNGEVAAFDADDFARRERAAIRHAGTPAPATAHARAEPVPLQRGAELSQVDVPTFVIQGGQDPLNPPPHGQHIADLIPTARHAEIGELGHALPKQLLPKIADLLITHFRASN